MFGPRPAPVQAAWVAVLAAMACATAAADAPDPLSERPAPAGTEHDAIADYGEPDPPATDLVCDRCVGDYDLAGSAVKGEKIADGALAAAELAAGSVVAEKILPGAIVEGKLADGAAKQAKLAQQSVGTNKFADAAVTRAKLAPDAVGTNKIEDGVVTFEKIALDVQGRFNALEAGLAALRRIPVGADRAPEENCAALRAALEGITDNGPRRRYLVKLGPGTYDCSAAATGAASAVVMREYVDLEGSGQSVTRIVSATGDGAVVELAERAELRQLTVENQSPSAAAHVLRVTGPVPGRVAHVTLSGAAAGSRAAMIDCRGNSSTTVLHFATVNGAGATDNGCSLAFVRSQLAAPPAAAQVCIASYDGRFRPLDRNCRADARSPD